MHKKECTRGTWGLGTHVPHSFCIPASSQAPKGIAGKGTIQGDIKRSVKARKSRHWLHRAAFDIAINPAQESHYTILDKNYSKSRRGFRLDREKEKARKISPDQQSLYDLIPPFKWWEDSAHKKQIKACFVDYLVDIEDKGLLLRSLVSHKPIVKDYAVRFSSKRLKKTRWQLGGIKLDFGTHLVLTVDPKRSHNLVESVKGLRAEWNDLRRWLQRYFGVKTISYIEVLEFGKKHDLPHLHILMARVFFEAEDLKAIYKWRGEQRIRVTRIRDFNALGYVLKYATKVFNDFDVVKDSQAYLYWVTDAKVYGMSRDHYKSIHSREVAMVAFGWFMRMIEGEEYEGFEYVGIFDWCVLDPPPPIVTDEWVDLHIGG